MVKKSMKILMVLMVAIIALNTVSVVFADAMNSYNPDGAVSSASTSIGHILDNVLGIVQVVGIGIAVIMLIVLAIKYISSAPNDKAEIKKHAVVYVVGAVLLFAASGVIALLRNFSSLFTQGVSNGTGTVQGH